MIAHTEPMTTFTLAEWRAYKKAVRRLKYARRMQQGKEPNPAEFIQALRRDDAGDRFHEEQHPGAPAGAGGGCLMPRTCTICTDKNGRKWQK